MPAPPAPTSDALTLSRPGCTTTTTIAPTAPWTEGAQCSYSTTSPAHTARSTPSFCLVIGRSRVRIPPRAQNRRSEGISGIGDCVAATGAHSFGLDHRAAGAPVTLRYVGVPPASPLGRGSDAAPRNAVWNVGARPSREVDRGRHDF